MKVQTAILLLCFLSGVFLSVVHAKPSPALMRELIALEKYLEKKEGSEGLNGQNENPGETPTGEEFKNLESLLGEKVGQNDVNQNLAQVQENKPPENENDKPKNENNNNGGGETNTAEGSGGGVGEETPYAGEEETPTGPEVDVPPAKPEEGSVPSATGEEEPHEEASGVEGEGEKPQEGNRPSPSEGQVEKGRDQIFEVLDEVTRKIKDALEILSTLGEDFRKQFQNDDRKFKELEDKDAQTKEKTKEKYAQLKTAVEDIKSAVGLDETRSVGKKSVRENAPARRSHISDTEFLNVLHSLLTYS